MVERLKYSEPLFHEGLVKITKDKGTLKLRWSVENKRYSLSPGLKDTPLHWKTAQKIASQIELDILSGNFDCSLDKYRLKPISKPQRKEEKQEEPKAQFVYALDLYKAYLAANRIPKRTYYAHHHYVLRMLEKSNPKLETLKQWMESITNLAPKTWNDRLFYLKQGILWAQKEKLLPEEFAFTELESRFLPRKLSPTRKPFTSQEIKLILEALKNDQFRSEYSQWSHSHYYPYFAFQLYTGCRPAEVIGLQWKHIDFERKEVEISTVLARGDRGQTSSKHRVRKETKNGMVRFLPMDQELYELLKSLYRNQGKEELVFPSPTGKSIDDKNTRSRIWKPILEGLKIPYRVPYAGRHSMISRAIEQGVPLTGLAYLAGHTDTKMIHEHYGHMINRPALPSL